MGKINVETCGIEGLKIITPAVYGDERGYFYESYHYEAYREAGISEIFVQDNQSSGRRGVLRGTSLSETVSPGQAGTGHQRGSVRRGGGFAGGFAYFRQVAWRTFVRGE